MSTKFIIEIIDDENIKKIDTRQEVTVLNVKALQKQKTEIENEVVRLNKELTQINEILDEYQKLT